MAKKSTYSLRSGLPFFKLFLLLTVLVALPITVFSVNNVSTNLKQEASGTTPAPTTPYATCTSKGGSCYKYDCPTGYTTISGTCGLMNDPACCKPRLTTPTNLSYTLKCTNNASYSTKSVDIKASWNNVVGASYYKVNGFYYFHNNGYKVPLSGYPKTNSHTFSFAMPIDVNNFYFNVAGYNSTLRGYGPQSSTLGIPVKNCK